MPHSSLVRSLLLLLFMISGFAGLIYESIWSHYLKLFLGHAAYAQTLVLVIFMGGMAWGSWLVSRHSWRITNLLLGYVVVEVAIGLLGLAFHELSKGATSWAFDTVIPVIGTPWLIGAFKWTLGAALILPQSMLLGATFPLMSGAIVRRFPERSGSTLAMLYFTNSLGAAAGVLASGFVLVGWIGLPGTIMTAGLLNLVLALCVWSIARNGPDAANTPATGIAARSAAIGPLERAILIGAFATGAAAFMYEIAWIRMLSLVLGSSTHAFELMLSAFILGIALGGFWVRNRIQAISDPMRFLGKVMLIMATVAMVTLFFYNSSFTWMAAIVAMFTPTEAGFIGYHIGSHAIALALMVPTTFFCGMTLPVMTNSLVQGRVGERAIGAVYAWNTVGAIVGTVLAVHLLMPALGVKGLMISGGVVHVALGAWFLARSGGPRVPVGTIAIAGAAGLALLAAIFVVSLDPRRMTSGVYRHGVSSQPAESRVMLFEHGKTASISLVEEGDTVVIATNGKPDAAINVGPGPASADEITMVMAAALPLAMHPAPRQIANIGIGSALTTHTLLTDPAVVSVDTIEIEPEMARAARAGFMPRVRNAFNDPRSHLHFEDAKTFFASRKRRYDIIVSEPSNPWVSGVASLFSEEFYDQLDDFLEPDGLLVQWLQIYETDTTTVTSVLRAMSPHFQDFALYRTDDANMLIIATPANAMPGPTDRVFGIPALREELARVDVTTQRDFDSRFVGNKRLLQPALLLSGVPANSDYFPYVDQNAIRARILRRDALSVLEPSLDQTALLDLLLGRPAPSMAPVPRDQPMWLFDQQARRATLLANAITEGERGRLNPDAVRLVSSLSVAAPGCTGDSGEAWLDSVFQISVATTPVLGSDQLRRLWQVILATPCGASLSEGDSAWLGFLRAVAQRDRVQVRTLGKQLLEGSYVFRGRSQLTYAARATVAAAIGEGDIATAGSLLREFGTEMATTASKWTMDLLDGLIQAGQRPSA